MCVPDELDSEGMEQEDSSEPDCTLSIEDSSQSNNMDMVSCSSMTVWTW